VLPWISANLPKDFWDLGVQQRRRPWPNFVCLFGDGQNIFFHELGGRKEIGELCDMSFLTHTISFT